MNEITFLRVKGEPERFECDCGCKLFAVLENNQYRCQNCDSLYEAEPEE